MFDESVNVKEGQLKEHDYVCQDELRQSAHTALKEEYKAASMTSKSDKLVLEQGILIKQIGDYYCYLFEVSQLVIESYSFDKPHRFEISKKHIDGQVYSAAEGKVEIHLTESYGKILHELSIIFDVCILLDLVDRRLVGIDRNSKELHLSFTNNLFRDLDFQHGGTLPKVCNHNANENYRGLNVDQLNVVGHCLSNKFTLIWGPPGTGKSYTLLALIAEILASNKTILFSSNTNSAIDNVLEDIAKESCPYDVLQNQKDNAKIVRLGSQIEPLINENFSPKGLALIKSDAIREVVTELKQKQYSIERRLSGWEEMRNAGQRAKKIIEKYNVLVSKIEDMEPISILESRLANYRKCWEKYLNLDQQLTPVIENYIKAANQCKVNLKNYKDNSSATELLLIKVTKEIDEKKNIKQNISKEINQIESSWFKKKFNKSDLERLNKELSNVNDDLIKLNAKKNSYNGILSESAKSEVKVTKILNDIFNGIQTKNTDIETYHKTVEIVFKQQNFGVDKDVSNAIIFLDSFINNSSQSDSYNKIKNLVERNYLNGATAGARNLFFRKKTSTLETLKNSYATISAQIENIKIEKVDAEKYISKNRNNLAVADGKIDDLKKILNDTLKEIREEEKKLEEIESTIIKEANMLCLTMVKASYDQQIVTKKYDVLIVDEFSMVSLPQLYCVASLIKEKIVLCGDHLQLPPICQSDEVEAVKWMGQSFYEWHEGKIGETNPNIAGIKGRISSYMANLEVQHRMPTDISNLIKPWYVDQGLHLKDKWVTVEDDYLIKYSDHVFLDHNVTILDTSNTHCYSSKSISKSRYNLVHAAIISYLCKEFTENHGIDPNKIICLSPYKHQASLIKSISHQICPSVSEKISERTWTIHKSQGRGGAIVIYDLTDGVESGLSGFHKAMAPNLLNVAISRSKARLIIVCALDKMITRLNSLVNNPLRQVFERMASISVPVCDVTPYYKEVFKRIDISNILSSGSVDLTAEQRKSILVLSSHEYYKVLAKDISNAEKSILIVSPFITPRRMEKIEPLITQALISSSDKLRVEIITRPPEKMFDRTKADSVRAKPVQVILDRLVEMGIKVTLAYNTHEKLIIIDEKINYWGSLNSLSFRDTDEVNTRLEAEGLANKLLEFAVQGRTESYHTDGAKVREEEYRQGIKNIAEKELNEFAWILAGYYKRPRMAFLYNKTITGLIENPPISWAEYRRIPEISQKNSVLRNHLDQLEDIIHVVRGYRLEGEVIKSNRKPKQGKLFPDAGIISKVERLSDVINRNNIQFRTLDKILKSGAKPDPTKFTFGDCKKILINFFEEMTQKSMKKEVVAGKVIKSLKVNTRGKPYAELLRLFNKALADCIGSGKLVEKTTAAGVVRIQKP